MYNNCCKGNFMISKVGFEGFFKTRVRKNNSRQDVPSQKSFVQKIKDKDKETAMVAVAAVGATAFMAATLIRKFNPTTIINSIKKTDAVKVEAIDSILDILEAYSLRTTVDGQEKLMSVFDCVKQEFAKTNSPDSIFDSEVVHRVILGDNKQVAFIRDLFNQKACIELLKDNELVAKISGVYPLDKQAEPMTLFVRCTPRKKECIYVNFTDDFKLDIKEGETVLDYFDDMIVDRGYKRNKAFIKTRYKYAKAADKSNDFVVTDVFKNLTLLDYLEAADASIRYSPDGKTAKLVRFLNKAQDDNSKQMKVFNFIKNEKGTWDKADR